MGRCPERAYQDLFPAALLRNEARLEESDINLALNSGLVTWNTNRNISAKEPVAYLRELVERASLGAVEILNRLSSHTIPLEELNVGGYSDIECKEDRSVRIKSDFDRILAARFEAVSHRAAKTDEEGAGVPCSRILAR